MPKEKTQWCAFCVSAEMRYVEEAGQDALIFATRKGDPRDTVEEALRDALEFEAEEQRMSMAEGKIKIRPTQIGILPLHYLH